ncbi:hypothetical protein H2201_004946 [Coniosporium apollinis]|uniref:Uncharacterized protein n=1 Tax=Coniosporium apollinis TaxID=61459 RepID=A0ABQ9NUF2_9PEZI|nr:hypothetical protein H2201_004946 [Coniosporium apollinis]
MAHVSDYHEQSNPFRSTYTVASSSRASFPNAGIYSSPRSPIPHSSHEVASSAGHDRSRSSYPPSPETAYAPDNFSAYGGRPDKVVPSEYTSGNDDGNLAPRFQPKQRDNSARDPEKDAGTPSGAMFWRQSVSPAGRSRSSSLTYGQDDEDEGDTLEDKALTILIHLCGFACLLSTAIVFWTVISVLLALLLQPARLCSFRPSFRDQLVKFLDPAMKMQLRCIYSSPESTSYSVPLLLIVNICSPIVSGALAVASWVTATFWFFSAMLGDPAGKDGHNDGKAAVLGVRRWWEQWLLRALR